MIFLHIMLENRTKNYLCPPKQKKGQAYFCLIFRDSDLNHMLKRKNYVLDT
jgi:hypothetical protein